MTEEKKAEQGTAPMSFRLTPELREALKASAEKAYRPVSQHVAWIIANYLDEEGGRKAPREPQNIDQSLGQEKTPPAC